jgi:hypothetical protein
LDRPQRPFFRPGEGGIDEGFGQIDFPAVSEIRGQSFEQAIEAATALPELKSTVTRLIRRIARGQVGPGRAGAQDPQHAVEHRARIGPGPPAPVGAAARTKRRFQKSPLGVR